MTGVPSQEPWLLRGVNTCVHVSVCLSVMAAVPAPDARSDRAFTPPKREAISSQAFKTGQDLNPLNPS